MWGNQGGFSGYGNNDGGGGGGGFMQGSPGFNNSPQTGPGGSSDRPKRSRSNNIIPCTVANIMAAENADGSFRIMDGKVELGQIVLVGMVKAVRELPTRIDYEMDDCTGPILDIRQFTDSGDDPSEVRSKPIPENTYMKAFGHIREINNKRMFAAFKVEAVEDMNALTTHMLEIVYSRLYYTNMKADENMNVGGDYKPSATGQPGGAAGDFNNGLTNMQSQVHRMIGGSMSESGISIQDLISGCQGLSEKQIRDSIEFLSGEGHIYSTIDDDHYRTTDS